MNDDGSTIYGKPLITIGVLPFGVNTQLILNQFRVSMASWLRCSAQTVVHCYDVIDGMGLLFPILLADLQREFGAARILVRGLIVRQKQIETLPEIFEAIERNAETEFAGWFSNDMILPPEWMNVIYPTRRYFREYKNYSFHFARRDLFVSCRSRISLANVVGPNWTEFANNFTRSCRGRLHSFGYDCYLWNRLGINMTAAELLPFYVGRPLFDGEIIRKQMAQGWFVSAFPLLVTFHLEHPDRIQFVKRMKHPESRYNAELFEVIGKPHFINKKFDLRVGKRGIIERRNQTWHRFRFERPIGSFPLAYAAEKTHWDYGRIM
jgi:hypothetical protein